MKTNLPLEHHTWLAGEITPSMRWNGSTPIEEWREKCTEKLWELLGIDQILLCEPIFEITQEDELAGFRHIHFTLQTEQGYFTHCDLLLPKEQTGKLPLCVCLQGHTMGAHISLGIDNTRIGDNFCVRAAQEGFAALAIEQRAFGGCGGSEQGPQCIRPSITALLLGRTIIGERVWDVMRVVDAVEAHFSSVITMEGSVLMGNSGGGTTTYYTACLEHRFSGFIPSCALCTYRGHLTDIYNCVCNYVPGIAKYFDMSDLAVMIAPKKMTVVCAEPDPFFSFEGSLQTYYDIKKIYTLLGAEQACALVIGHDGHRFYPDEAWPVMKQLLAQEKVEND